HLGVPAFGLVSEVNARFEQFLHGDVCQATSYKWIASSAVFLRSARDSFPVPALREDLVKPVVGYQLSVVSYDGRFHLAVPQTTGLKTKTNNHFSCRSRRLGKNRKPTTEN